MREINRRVAWRRLAGIGLTLVIVALALTAAEEPADEFTPPEGLPDGWFAQIETSKGVIVARLLPDQAPQSVAYFTALAQGRLAWRDEASGEDKKIRYYDGTRVHKLVAGRLFEAGRPADSDQIAPDLTIPMEGLGPINFSRPGRLGMLRDGGVVSGVKFVVTAAAEPWFNGRHPCFGEVLSGRDVVVNVSLGKTSKGGTPVDPSTIDRIRIFSVGQVAPLPQPEPYVHQLTRPTLRPKPEPPATD